MKTPLPATSFIVSRALLVAQISFALPALAAPADLDPTFGSSGKVTTQIGSRAFGESVAVQGDGKIVVAGSAFNGSHFDIAVVRYNTDGSLDTSFNGGSGDLDFGLARFTSSGALEFSVTTNLATIGSGVSTQTSRDAGSSVALQSDGKIVLAGSIEIPAGYSDFALVRYANDTPRQMFDNAAAAAGLTGAAESPDAIPFHGGVTNLLKYAFRMNLAGADVHPPPHGGNAGLPVSRLFHDAGQTYWQIEFVRLKGSGLIYTPLKSTTLESNSFVPMTGAVTVQSLGAECERVIVKEPVDSPRIFNRVQVTLPP